MPLSRRQFLYGSAAAGAGLFLSTFIDGKRVVRAVGIPGGTLDPGSIGKFVTPLLIPPVMPRAGTKKMKSGKVGDVYEISVRQLVQQILPAGMPATTVWGYGAVKSGVPGGLLLHNAPSLTIEAQVGRPVEVKWINDLVDEQGNYLPHLLPVDPTLHWANPPGGIEGRDTRPMFDTTPGRYTGPVPMVTHVHGAVGVGDESDGYPEAWFLPAARNIPAGYATEGTWYRFFKTRAAIANGATWGPGFATFEYPNLNRASTIWYHDHALGMTRLNVYAGPAGFFLLRGGKDGDAAVVDRRSGRPAVLPGPAPKVGDAFPPNKTYYEIPIAIQDRSFNADGSLFYPDSREFFDGITGPFLPEGHMGHEGFSPIWNPEFFGNSIMVNGNTWPYQVVEKRRYRFRFLDGCQARFLILDFNEIPGVRVWQIGNEGGFLEAPVNITGDHDNRLLMSPAERADVIVDFADVPVGNYVLGNVGPDEPYGGGIPGPDFDSSDSATTGQVMQFRVVPAVAADPTTPPKFLRLPAIAPLPAADRRRPLALIEKMGMGGHDALGNPVDGPMEAVLGTADSGNPVDYMWMDNITENPRVGDTEIWEFFNTTGDAHPMHVHEVVFEVLNREGLVLDAEGNPEVPLTPCGARRPPEAWEKGLKDTVTAYPGEVTRVKATFGTRGTFVWHCHIVEHEDNEMMRPYRIGLRRLGEPR